MSILVVGIGILGFFRRWAISNRSERMKPKFQSSGQKMFMFLSSTFNKKGAPALVTEAPAWVCRLYKKLFSTHFLGFKKRIIDVAFGTAAVKRITVGFVEGSILFKTLRQIWVGQK